MKKFILLFEHAVCACYFVRQSFQTECVCEIFSSQVKRVSLRACDKAQLNRGIPEAWKAMNMKAFVFKLNKFFVKAVLFLRKWHFLCKIID